MTDYLEELLDNTAALLEQVRRLERSASGPVPERAGEEASSPAFHAVKESAEERAFDRRPETGETLRNAEQRETGRQSVSGAASGGGEREDGALEPPERILTPLEEEQKAEGSVLLEQMERLERAAVSETAGGIGSGRSAGWSETGVERRNGYSAGLPEARSGSVFPSVTGAAGEGWSLGTGFVGTDVRPGEELRWAERADRAFRRDSRRYDGEFYLY